MIDSLKDLTKLDLFAMFAPEPSEEQVSLHQQMDRQRNPYNDGPPKPRIRERVEIIAELKFDYGKAMLNQSSIIQERK